MDENGIPLAIAAFLTWDLFFPSRSKAAEAARAKEVDALRRDMAAMQSNWRRFLATQEGVNADLHQYLSDREDPQAEVLRDKVAMFQHQISNIRIESEE